MVLQLMKSAVFN